MSSLSSSLNSVEGFHTTFSSNVTVRDPRDIDGCSLSLFYRLPPRIFVDPYELANYAGHYSFKLWGTTNLELPVTAVNQDGSAILLSVDTSDTFTSGKASVSIDLPLHARYGALDQPTIIEIPDPTGFWVCPKTSHSLRPIPEVPSEVAASFNMSSSIFKLVDKDSLTPAAILHTPVGHLADSSQVEIATSAVVLLGFFYLLYIAAHTASNISKRHQHAKVE
ncbi:hypothetical protein HWV62_20652 [Athelia sp. TMB]|nr:hypothetical protein HWV62_20652 [Athelia sp. TMB]